MHNCARCGRPASSLQEIHDGCPCGSKVFRFSGREEEKPEQAPEHGALAEKPLKPGLGGKQGQKAENGKVPPAYFARATFSSEDVENIKIVSEGVFFVDVNSLSKNPVVLRDEEGVYYVRIPFEETKWDGKKNGSNGTKKKKE